jgi:hypothetical protein
LAGDTLQLSVIWSDKRTVRVDVEFEPPIASFALRTTPEEDGGEPTPIGLDPEDMESRPAIVEFLREATRAVATGERVRAVCWSTEKGKLYKVLGIDGDYPQPIEIRVGP